MALNFGRMENMESGNGNGTGTGTSELKTVLWVSMTIVDLVRIFILIRCIHFLIKLVVQPWQNSSEEFRIHVNDATWDQLRITGISTHFRFRIPCFNATGYIVD